MHWNANELKEDLWELEDFISKRNIHVVLVSETHWNQNFKAKLKGFSIYRTDRINRAWGGTAILINNQIPHSHRQNENLNKIEATSVEILLEHGQRIILTAPYNPPNVALNKQDL